MSLAEILRRQVRGVESQKKALPLQELRLRLKDAPSPRDFKGAILKPPLPSIIAEIKRASPSAGIILEGGCVTEIARCYEEAGAAAISVVTEEYFFKGSLESLEKVRGFVSIPVLRKDFIIEGYQVLQSRVFGADAILLIASLLNRPTLCRMLALSKRLGMQALVEIHDQQDLQKAIECGAQIIGINNRDLANLQVDLGTTERLAGSIPSGKTVISESGIRSGRDIQRLSTQGVHAFLVGEKLMRSKDIGKTFRELAGDKTDDAHQDMRDNMP